MVCCRCRVNELARYLVVGIWLLINIGITAWTYYNYGVDKKYVYLRAMTKGGLPFARIGSNGLTFNCALIPLTMCRNLISIVRSYCNRGCMKPVIRVLDKSVTFHRYIAYMICLQTLIHVGAHCFNFENLTMSWHIREGIELNNKLSRCYNWFRPIENGSVYPVAEAFQSIPALTGVIITLALILMVSSSTELIRRSYFEIFWYSHHLFIVFFLGLVIHGAGDVLRFQTNVERHDPTHCMYDLHHWGKNGSHCETMPKFGSTGAMTWKFVGFSMLLYTIERCVRFYRSRQPVQVTMVIRHPSNVLQIRMKKKGFKCEAGQYIFIQCPKISQLEWHPFTLTSAPEEDYFSVHIRIAGDWTAALQKEFAGEGQDVKSPDDLPMVTVDGPYGTASTDVFKYQVVMCIGAGIGVTPFASVLKSIWYQYQQFKESLFIKKVYFYWICRESFAFEWFSDLLKHLEDQMEEANNFIEINIFLTKWNSEMAKRILLEEPTAMCDPITGLFSRTEYGRPPWKTIFKHIADSHPNTKVGVFFCGPSGLSRDLHKMCDQSNDETKGIQFIYNKENF